MQCSVWLFGRIGIVSADSKSSHCIQHLKPHQVPLGGGADRCGREVQPHVICVSAGPYHAAVVTATGDVYTWGSGFAGQLASGRRDNAVWPQVVKASVYSRALHSLRVDQVACGGAHTLMRFDDGTVASCGCDRDGQLGQGTVYECSIPLAVAGLSSRKIRQVACGGMHTLLLDDAGKLLAFGSGANGRLGLGNTTNIAKPAEVTALSSVCVKSIACGWSSSMCVASSAAPGRASVGLVYTWGHGDSGRLGHGNDQDGRGLNQDVWSPRVVDELRRCGCHVTQCSMGHQHAAVKTGSGDVWVWGSGSRGQLGLGSTSSAGTSLPSKMQRPPASAGSVIKVLCGAAHTVILTSFGKVLVCGAASAGQLGLGAPLEDICIPTPVTFPTDKLGTGFFDDERFACDVGVGWECTIVVTHVKERAQDASIGSISSGSRLRGVSDCSDTSDVPIRDAPSPSASDISASFLIEGSSSGTPLPSVAECPLAACITGARMGGDGRTRYFAFRCAFGDLIPWVSYKRYSECLKLSNAVRTDPRAPNFPAKSWGISRLLAGEEELAAFEEERQQALQTWFDHYLEQGILYEDYGKFLIFFEVGRQQKLQGGQACEEVKAGVTPDVTLCEGATRTEATASIAAPASKAVANASFSDSCARHKDTNVPCTSVLGSERRESDVDCKDKTTLENDVVGVGVTDSDDFTTEGAGSTLATPQKQRLCEDDDPELSNLLQTPNNDGPSPLNPHLLNDYTPPYRLTEDKRIGDDLESIPGSISLFQTGVRDGVLRRSPMAGSGVGSFDDMDRCSWMCPRSQHLALSGFINFILPECHNSNRWLLEILEPNFREAIKRSQVRSFWRRGIPPYVRGKVWKKAIGNKLSIESDLYEYNRNQARAIFRNDAAAAAAPATATFSGSGSFRSPSPWIRQDERSSSAQQFATRGAGDLSYKDGKGMRRVSSSGLLLLAEDGSNGTGGAGDQLTWFDWNMGLGSAGSVSDSLGTRIVSPISEIVRNVPQDVSRTMQHLQLFQEDCPYERDLRDVLGAFALMRQDVGYVQSMSYIAAMFLLYSDTPFDAFLAFSNEHLSQRHHAFKQLFSRNLPDLNHRFDALDIGVHLYLDGWFTCMFAKCLEPRLVSRVWDMYLCDGAVAAYKVAIALLKLRGPGVAACPFEEVGKRLTGIASHDESDLFELCKQVELPAGLKAHIEELEGERNEAQ